MEEREKIEFFTVQPQADSTTINAQYIQSFAAYDNVCTTVLTYDLLNISNCVEQETEMMQAQSGTVMNSTQQYTKPFNVKVRDGSTEARTVDAIYFPSLKYNIFGEKTVTEILGHQVILHVSLDIPEIFQEINSKKCSLELSKFSNSFVGDDSQLIQVRASQYVHEYSMRYYPRCSQFRHITTDDIPDMIGHIFGLKKFLDQAIQNSGCYAVQ